MLFVSAHPGGQYLQVAFPPREQLTQIDISWYHALRDLPSWDGGKVSVEDFYHLASRSQPPRPIQLHESAPPALNAYLQQTQWAKDALHTGPNLDGLVKNPLWSDQEEIVRFLYWRQKAGNFSSVGMGKTVSALAWFSLLRREGKATRAVVLCRNDVKKTWSEQLKQHFIGTWKIVGNGSDRVIADLNSALEDGSEIVVGHYDLLRNREILLLMHELQAEVLIADESHCVKHITSERTKGFLRLLQAARYPYLLFMSASPVSENPVGAWMFLHCVAPHRVRGHHRFRDYFTNELYRGKYKRILLGYKNLDHLRELVTDVSIRKTHEDAKGMPEVVYKTHHVPLTNAHALTYNDMAEGVYQGLVTRDGQLQELRLDEASSRLLRLRQFLTLPSLVGSNLESPKLAAVESLLEVIMDDPKAKVLIWSCFKDAVRLIQETYEKNYGALAYHGDMSVEERATTIDAFREDPKHRILVCTPDAAHLGLNLQVARVSINVDRPLRWDMAEQSDGRITRRDATGTATIIDLVVVKAVDEWVRGILKKKKEMKDQVLDGSVKEVNTVTSEDLSGLVETLRTGVEAA